jgi:hypothetical protein
MSQLSLPVDQHNCQSLTNLTGIPTPRRERRLVETSPVGYRVNGQYVAVLDFDITPRSAFQLNRYTGRYEKLTVFRCHLCTEEFTGRTSSVRGYITHNHHNCIPRTMKGYIRVLERRHALHLSVPPQRGTVPPPRLVTIGGQRFPMADNPEDQPCPACGVAMYVKLCGHMWGCNGECEYDSNDNQKYRCPAAKFHAPPATTTGLEGLEDYFSSNRNDGDN